MDDLKGEKEPDFRDPKEPDFLVPAAVLIMYRVKSFNDMRVFGYDEHTIIDERTGKAVRLRNITLSFVEKPTRVCTVSMLVENPQGGGVFPVRAAIEGIVTPVKFPYLQTAGGGTHTIASYANLGEIRLNQIEEVVLTWDDNIRWVHL